MKRWRGDDGVHFDLRGLQPPEPMIEVLLEIDSGTREPLILHMDRDPIFLYPELEERGWSARRLVGPGADDRDGPAVMLELRPDSAS